jgi:hypothetical protein
MGVPAAETGGELRQRTADRSLVFDHMVQPVVLPADLDVNGNPLEFDRMR